MCPLDLRHSPPFSQKTSLGRFREVSPWLCDADHIGDVASYAEGYSDTWSKPNGAFIGLIGHTSVMHGGTLTATTAATSIFPVRRLPDVPAKPWHKRVPVSHPLLPLALFGYSATPSGACRIPTCLIQASASTSSPFARGSSCAVLACRKAGGSHWGLNSDAPPRLGSFRPLCIAGVSPRSISAKWQELSTGAHCRLPIGSSYHSE